MRVIIVGSGEVGRHIAVTLSDEKHDVTVIERDEERAEELQGELDALVVAGNGASPKFLKQIGAEDADLLLAVTEGDEVNVIAAAAGHRLGVEQTLARVRDPDYFGEDNAFVRDVLGIDYVIDPERATAEDIADTLLLPGAVHVEQFAEGRLVLAETIVDERSPLVGTIVDDRERARPHSIVGVVRRGRATIPAARERLALGDRLVVVAAREEIAPVIAALAGGVEEVHDVMIFGGGKIGAHLARRLERSDCEVRVIERDADRARELAQRFPHTLVLHEEELNEDVLLSHGVDRAGAFVTCAGDDRTNLLAASHAKHLGARVCLAVVSRDEFVPLVDALPIDGAFSLRLTTAEAILRLVHSDSVRAMHITLTGAEVLDLHAEPGSEICGQPISAADALEGCEVGAIVRDDEVVIPADGESILAGDRVLVFRLHGAAGDVERAFNA